MAVAVDDAAGGFLADHVVELNVSEWEFEAFTDLYEYLRWNVSPDRRVAHERELVTAVGDWIGGRVLGPVGAVLAGRRGPVRVQIPPQAAVLGYRPWELARVGGRSLVEHRVNLVIDQQPHRPLVKAEVGDRLRMLSSPAFFGPGFYRPLRCLLAFQPGVMNFLRRAISES